MADWNDVKKDLDKKGLKYEMEGEDLIVMFSTGEVCFEKPQEYFSYASSLNEPEDEEKSDSAVKKPSSKKSTPKKTTKKPKKE